ncbi:MAG: glycosyltransferase [Acinetobacter sp.]
MKQICPIINIGRLPPPVGGISYFLKRLKQHLDDRKIKNVMIDVSGMDTQAKIQLGVRCMPIVKAFAWLLVSKQSIVVFHSNRFPILVGSFFLSYRHKIVIFTHGESILKKTDFFKRLCLGRVTALVAPIAQLTQRIKTQYPEYESKVFHIPFILFPPTINIIDQCDIQHIRAAHKILLSAYAYDIMPMNGVDLYGVDMLIELMQQLRDEGYDVGMILVLPACSETEYANERLKQIEESDFGGSLLVYPKCLDEASDLFALSDIYVRPSASDGDSFAVWEALHVGTPVVVSDAVARPNGCRLFRSRDQADFLAVTKQVIEHIKSEKEAVSQLMIKGSENELLAFFEGLMNN